jgi:hypothetical protein
MHVVSSLDPLLKAVRAFFRHDVALRRDGSAVRLVLKDPAQPVRRAPTRAEVAAERERRELQRSRNQLRELLDIDPSQRGALRELAFLEQVLARKGWSALHRVQLGVLESALQQLESLVTNWSPEGLACLRSKMAVALAERQAGGEAGESTRGDLLGLPDPPLAAAQAIEAAKASAQALPDVEDADAAALRAAYEAMGVATTAGR